MAVAVVHVPEVTHQLEAEDVDALVDELHLIARAASPFDPRGTAARLQGGWPDPDEPAREESAVLARALDHVRNLGFLTPRLDRLRSVLVAGFSPITYEVHGYDVVLRPLRGR